VLIGAVVSFAVSSLILKATVREEVVEVTAPKAGTAPATA
jgi:mannitol-specific phosphotransferase system IIBC component